MKKHILSDIIAGLTVSFAALSLGAAFGVMSHRGAMSGMIGAAIIPIITSLLGGTRIQASGPTAPMTAITALIVAFAHDKFADNSIYAEQLITLTIFLSSGLIILTGLFRLGNLIRFVPQVVVLGFMNGIAVLIWWDQLKKLFHFGGAKPIGGDMTTNIIVAFSTLLCIYMVSFTLKKIGVKENIRRFLPGILITIVLFTFLTQLLNLNIEHVELGAELKSFSDVTNLITNYFPSAPELFTLEMFWLILPYAAQLCMLAYLDSLLTSLVIDKMTKEKTNANKELFAQGIANGVSGLLQGIPGAQATIRSVILINEGAKTRFAGVLVGIFALLGFIVFSGAIKLIVSAVFVGVLFKAGLDVFDRDFLKAYFKLKWQKNKKRNIQLLFIAYTTIITAAIDLNIAVFSGTIFYYLGKKYFNVIDAEVDFALIESNEITG